jgi:hypothetical protein
MRRRPVPKNTEVIMRGEPVLINGGGTIKALSAEFLYDVQQYWRKNKTTVLDDVAKKYPAQFFAGMVSLSKVMRWEMGEPGAFDRPRTPEEVVERLEQRLGPQARKLFERFLEQINQLEREQQGVIDNEDEGAEATGTGPDGVRHRTRPRSAHQ